MSLQPNTRSTTPVADELPIELVELARAMNRLPSEHRFALDPIFARVVESTKRRRRIMGLVQDALSQLRMDMKYLMFDLEATRRERDDWRRQAEGTPPTASDD
jgi:hypothetical protein